MKKIFLLTMLQVLFLGDAYGLVKLKNVTQKGAGNTGSIRIEFNGTYRASKAELEYKSDRVEILMKDAFTLPANRVFKVSSEKSSVSKMTSKLTPGNLVKLSIFFRTPIEIIKQTGKLSSDNNLLIFTYKVVADEPVATEEVKTDDASAQKEDKPLDAYYQAMNQENVIEDNGGKEKIESAGIIDEKQPEQDSLQSYSSNIKKLWRFLKGLLVIVLVVMFSIGIFYLYKRYSSGISENMGLSFGEKFDAPDRNREVKPKKDPFKDTISTNNINSMNKTDIRVLSSLELSHDKTIHVVEYAGEKMLIATSKDGVTMLSRLDGKTPSGEMDELDLFKSSKIKDRFGGDF